MQLFGWQSCQSLYKFKTKNRNPMRPLTLTAALLMTLCISSCTVSWQYITLDSHEVTKDASKRFAWENDTLRLVYDYSGYGGPIGVTISNKTDKPMYINWKKSALIKGGYATSLFQSNVQMTGSFDAARAVIGTSGTMVGSFSVPEGMDFIPPTSSITRNIDLLITEEAINKDKLTGDPKVLKVKGKRYDRSSYRLYTFDETSSPIQFKTYLTFVLGSDSAKEFMVNHRFYVSEIVLSARGPRYFGEYKPGGDVLYLARIK